MPHFFVTRRAAIQGGEATIFGAMLRSGAIKSFVTQASRQVPSTGAEHFVIRLSRIQIPGLTPHDVAESS